MKSTEGHGIIKGGILILFLFLMLTGCAKGSNPIHTTPAGVKDKTGNAVTVPRYLSSYAPTDYDSEDPAAVFMEADPEAKTLTFYNLNVKKNYTLSYDGTTRFYDRRMNGITAAQLTPGLIADVTFLKSNRHMNTLMLSPEAFSYEGVSRYEIDQTNHAIRIGDQNYTYNERLRVFSEGKKAELMDINPADKLTARGLGHEVITLSIDEGHGYLRLSGEEYFLGGWITVGESVVARVTKGMLLAVPEGRSDVLIENAGHMAEKSIIVKRGAEASLDLSDVEIEEVKTGKIIFTVSPENAELRIDGEKTDISKAVELEYGLHRIDLSAEGYESIAQYIRVATEGANVNLELNPVSETPPAPMGGGSVSGNTVSGNDSPWNNVPGSTVSGNTLMPGEYGESGMAASNPAITYITEAQTGESSEYRVRLDAPAEVEAYVDGSYVGILPIDFAKVPGSHVITLRLDGYRTRSYTVEIDSSPKDISFSFAELNPISN